MPYNPETGEYGYEGGGYPPPGYKPPTVPPPQAQDNTPAVSDDMKKLIEAITGSGGAYEKLIGAQFEGITPEQQQTYTGGLSSIASSLTGAAATNLQYGLGTVADPRFEAFRRSQLNSLAEQQRDQQARQSEFFRRRGISGSSAELNRQSQLGSQFGQEASRLTSQIGLQQLAQQNQSLAQASALYGQGAGLLGNIFGAQQTGAESRNRATQLGLEALVAGVETLSIPEQLRIALEAAKNAGEQGQAQSSGGIFTAIGNLFS